MNSIANRMLFGALLGLPTALHADILATGLSLDTAVYNGGRISIAANSSTTPPVPVLANGLTFNVEFSPTANDLSGTVYLMELGGTSNGSGLYLVNGVLTYCIKNNSGDDGLASSLNDTLLRPDSNSRGEAAVQSTFGQLTAGLSYSVAASWNQAGTLLLAVQSPSSGLVDQITLTGSFGNWYGDRSLGVGQVGGSAGGLSGELAGNVYGAPFDATDARPLAGDITRALYWNAAGTLQVPEPSTFALGALATLSLLLRRRL